MATRELFVSAIVSLLEFPFECLEKTTKRLFGAADKKGETKRKVLILEVTN